MKKNNTEQQLSLFPDEAFETPIESISDKTKEISVNKKNNSIQEVLSHPEEDHYDHHALFERLAQSTFRSGFHLKAKDVDYIRTKGMETIRQHAADFVAKRLAPAYIPNDGKQTPMRGHPVFLAQHATGCCCRGCFSKWHHIPAGRPLTIKEQRYAVSVLMAWIEKEYQKYK